MGLFRFCLLLGALGGCDFALGLDRGSGSSDTDDGDRDAGMIVDAPAVTSCPPSYIAIGSSSYRIVDSLVGWEEASSKCLVDGADDLFHTHLAVWADDSERLAVAPTTAGFYWIGLSDLRTSSVLRWNTGETGNVAGSIAWTPGQPAGRGCTTTRDDDHWELVSCEAPRGFICECDATPNDPSQYQ
jgi:hypothetical protein